MPEDNNSATSEELVIETFRENSQKNDDGSARTAPVTGGWVSRIQALLSTASL